MSYSKVEQYRKTYLSNELEERERAIDVLSPRVSKKRPPYHVYVLYFGNNPVYCGCTMDIETRLKQHSRDKLFDSYRVIRSHTNLKHQLSLESSIIKFIVAHNGIQSYNKQIEYCGYMDKKSFDKKSI